MKRLRLLPVVIAIACVAAAALVALAPVSGASASAGGCPTFRASVSGADAAHVIDFNFSLRYLAPSNPNMPYLKYGGQSALKGTTLTQARLHAYLIQGHQVTLHFGRMTYVFSPGSLFSMTCSGQSKGAPLKPTIYLGAGTVLVEDPSSFSGGAMSFEGLYGSVPGARGALQFTLTRTPVVPVRSLIDFIWTVSGRYATSIRGTSTVVIRRGGHLNVTPYAGPRIGSCRHVRGAVLNSARNTARYRF
jgi:hypothetical protein